MSSDDFNPANFLGLTSEEKVSKCHQMAAEAESFAADNPDHRDEYLSLATRWYQLAEEIQGSQRTRATGTVGEVPLDSDLLFQKFAIRV